MVYFPLIMTLIAGCFDQYLFLICLFTKTADYERYIMFFKKKKEKELGMVDVFLSISRTR